MAFQISDDASRALENIRAFQHDIAEFDERIKTLSEMTRDIVENTPESTEIQELSEKLAEAKKNQKLRLQAKAEYNDAMTDLADEREARKSALQHLSDALVVWYTLTGQAQIELTDEEARQVIVSAKLGKEQLYQTSLLTKE